MSGHSKWATTRHKKAVVDARRGKLFAKLIKNVEVAARTGGADPAGRRCTTPSRRPKSSVPNDNIERALKRGSGAEAGVPSIRPSPTRDTVPVVSPCWSRSCRQPQPGRVRGPHRDDPQRRLDGRPRVGVVHVQPQGRRRRAAGIRRVGRLPRTTSWRRCSTPAPKRSRTWARSSRSGATQVT